MKIKAPNCNLCIVCSVTTPNSLVNLQCTSEALKLTGKPGVYDPWDQGLPDIACFSYSEVDDPADFGF